MNQKISANKVKQLTAEQVKLDFLASHVALAVNSNLVVMNCLQEQINKLELVLKKELRLAPAFEQLTSIDGIGLILALTIMLETGEISRFDEVVPMHRGAKYSNGKKKGYNNSKNGNKFLSWAFTEAANFAIRYNETVKRYYQRKIAKTSNIVAIKTVAHKLARACFYVLKDQVELDVQKAFM